jgi:hypothetical protein
VTPTETGAAINRANSQPFTGLKPPKDKKRISLNALRLGLTGQLVVMPTKDLEADERHFQSFTDQYYAKGATEANLRQSAAFWSKPSPTQLGGSSAPPWKPIS